MKLKKKSLVMVLLLSFAVLPLSGCSQKEQTDKGDIQTRYDKSYAAKEFADKQIETYLKKNNPEYTVQETSYGFVASDESYYSICYKCENGKDELFYGYKISVDDQKNCNIIEEGKDVGRVLFE